MISSASDPPIPSPSDVNSEPSQRPSGVQADLSSVYARVEQAIEQIRQGKMIILVDDEDRENEGDLCMAAELVTPEAINFMATHARGLICVALCEEQVSRLQLPLMSELAGASRPGPPLGTAFTVSVEARHGVTTGISAADRAHTTRLLADPSTRPEDLVTPGHVFPLRARTGGVLVRAGQTEGSVDIARLAGLGPAGMICEIMNDDGTMARMPQLEQFATKHGLVILTIADLIQYRLRMDRLVRRVREQALQLAGLQGPWRCIVFSAEIDDRHIIAFVRGEPNTSDPVLVRMHAGGLLGDVFPSAELSSGQRLQQALSRIDHEGSGVVVYFPPRLLPQDELASIDNPPKDRGGVLHEYGLGVQVLASLGIRRLRLLTSTPKRLAGLGGFGVEIVSTEALTLHASICIKAYLRLSW